MANLKTMYHTILDDPFPDTLVITLGDQKLEYKKCVWKIGDEQKGLRYGENPDQPAALYRLTQTDLNMGGFAWATPGNAIVSALSEKQMVQAGKHPGKINLTDVDNGINILRYLWQKPACVILKHNNPCGVAWTDAGVAAALEAAFWSDRIAAFGGAIVVNRPFTTDAATLVSQNYFEIVAAPSYEEGTLPLLQKRKNLRILELPALASLESMQNMAFMEFKSLADGGLIVQRSFQNRIQKVEDFLPACASTPAGVEVCARRPNPAELEDLRFAWAVESGVTSNSVIFVRDGVTLSIGTGEQDRVGCVEIAVHKAYTKYADTLAFRQMGLSLYELKRKARVDKTIAATLEEIQAQTKACHGGLAGSRMVSDGFFPFRDGVDVAIDEGTTAIAQPGGSLRDAEVIMACNEAIPQVGMVFTGQRSFRH